MASEIRPDLNQDTIFDVTLSVDEAEALLNFVTRVSDCTEEHQPTGSAEWLLNRIHTKALECKGEL